MEYTAKQVNNIVANIHNQLMATAPNDMRYSWGAHSYQAILYHDMATLCFRVSGSLHKGWVLICYNEGSDLYDIYCLSTKHHVKKVNTGVYCDTLGQVIDNLVERPIGESDEAYRQRVMRDTLKKMC